MFCCVIVHLSPEHRRRVAVVQQVAEGTILLETMANEWEVDQVLDLK